MFVKGHFHIHQPDQTLGGTLHRFHRFPGCLQPLLIGLIDTLHHCTGRSGGAGNSINIRKAQRRLQTVKLIHKVRPLHLPAKALCFTEFLVPNGEVPDPSFLIKAHFHPHGARKSLAVSTVGVLRQLFLRQNGFAFSHCLCKALIHLQRGGAQMPALGKFYVSVTGK